MSENQIAQIIVDAAFELHKRTGAGMLERIYKDCLAHLLVKRGLSVEKEKNVPFHFDGIDFNCAYRLDLLVNDKVIVEIKSTDSISDIHVAQLITYLRLSEKKLGLIINFNSPLIKSGIRRVVNGLSE
jgi:GxxExxY protein